MTRRMAIAPGTVEHQSPGRAPKKNKKKFPNRTHLVHCAECYSQRNGLTVCGLMLNPDDLKLGREGVNCLKCLRMGI